MIRTKALVVAWLLFVLMGVTACAADDRYCSRLRLWDQTVKDTKSQTFSTERHTRAEELAAIAPADLKDEWQVVVELTDKDIFLRHVEEDIPDEQKSLRRIIRDGERMRVASRAIGAQAESACHLTIEPVIAERTAAPSR
ncbi:hypothetical protein E1263_08510 [Kribbella antibiotica]|uniref:Uncharacterized protein n=1 Tax=Kribbella antibiotica TaxID=190195 RepID=A0A4R4ZQI4_9ACTN|nr:hypothetical protein [Kribbella antibiotica]TDD61218.1 hypothetical protein E1263_08510 [Kribbella antibiotica]